MRLGEVGEFGLIRRLEKLIGPTDGLPCGIGDDAAALPYHGGKYQLFTTDMIVEGVDFLRRMPAEAIGRKALACNISDIAAMGGWPTFAVVSLALPKTTPVRFADGLYRGMARLAREFGVRIVGGDISRAEEVIINVALLGEVERRNLLTRRNARPGDWIFVTGPLGGSLKSGRHLTFTPRVAQARFLAKRFKPGAMIDISDGLAADLNHILAASGVGARLDRALIPLNPGVTAAQAMEDGEDFELLFTLSPAKARKLMAEQLTRKAFYFYPIGEITADKRQTIDGKGFTHF